MKDILTMGLGFLILPTLVVFLFTFTLYLLSPENIEIINSGFDSLEFFIGSFSFNLLMSLVMISIYSLVVKFFLKFLQS